MVLSRYNVKVQLDKETSIMYNLLHQKVMRINSGILSDELLANLSQKVGERFYPFIVPDTDEEYIYKDYLLNCLEFQSTRLNITLMMTMECNFRCVYCFERTSSCSQHDTYESINEEVFCNWVKAFVARYSIAEVSICFHGGEPMQEVEKVATIAKTLRKFFDGNHIFYCFSMVTNVYFLSKENCHTLANADVRIVQVTIDGLMSTHDSRRMLENGGGTFEQIVKNIDNLLEPTKLYMNVVFDQTTCSEIPMLLDYLVAHGYQSKIALVVLSPVKVIARDGKILDSGASHREVALNMVKLTKEVISRGFRTPNLLVPQVCTIKQKSSFVIHPSGNIYKCISAIGNPRFYIGRITENRDPFDVQHRVLSRQDKTCVSCKYSVICNRGCAYEADITGTKACQRAYFETLVPEYVKLLVMDGGRFIVSAPERDEWVREYVSQ